MDRKSRICNQKKQDFKVIGYYPCWEPDAMDKVNFEVLTHVNYAFAIPTEEGDLLPLRNPQVAQELISRAHAHGVKAMIVIGGWDYQDVPLEQTFAKGTDTEEKRKKMADQILELCMSYGFDGVDVDWEHPRLDNGSAEQYEALMLDLSSRLHSRGKLLTSAVTSGAAGDGTIFYDAAAQTDGALAACDWINVMAYDAPVGEHHSTYDFAVDCGTYWKEQRGLAPDKVVLGLPFYARLENGSYRNILERNPNACRLDEAPMDGKKAYYNGIPTIQKKTVYAKENLGGVMIWEVTQDTTDRETSLQYAIGGIAN